MRQLKLLFTQKSDCSVLIKSSFSVYQAFAEQFHERVRKDLWGYCSDEILDAKDLHRIKYQAMLFHLIV